MFVPVGRGFLVDSGAAHGCIEPSAGNHHQGLRDPRPLVDQVHALGVGGVRSALALARTLARKRVSGKLSKGKGTRSLSQL